MLEEGEFYALHLSNAILGNTNKSGAQSVFVTLKSSGDNVANRDIKNLCIARLSEKREQQALDIYLNVSQDITITTSGPGEVHLSGYFEPGRGAEEGALGDMGDLELEDDEDEEVESDELSDEEE